MVKRKILFLGEAYRADAITWMDGLKEFGSFEIITWELKTPNKYKYKRIIEFTTAISSIKKIIQIERPDMIIAERTTSYGFLAALSGCKIIAIAQQGRTDLWPENSALLPFKKMIQKYAFKKAHLIHAWGPVMTISMITIGVNMSKVLVLPKGIDLDRFVTSVKKFDKIEAIVTRSFQAEYRHDTILKAFSILDKKGIPFTLTLVGDGSRLNYLKTLVKELQIEKKVVFTGRVPNTKLPNLLQKANIYISMPITEGVSGSLFEAMASNCYPIVSDILGNQSWISSKKNGILVPVDDVKKLTKALLWVIKNNAECQKAICENRKWIEEYANYKVNMKIIADKYHKLIDINSIKT